MDIHICDIQKSPSKIIQRRHSITKLTKVKDKKKILRTARVKPFVIQKRTLIRLSVHFSAETLPAMTKQDDTLKARKGKIQTSTKSTVPTEVVLQKWKDEDFPPQIKAKEVHHHQPCLIRNVKGVLQIKTKAY